MPPCDVVSHLPTRHLLIPAARVHCDDPQHPLAQAERGLKLPHLTSLLARLRAGPGVAGDRFSASMPWERCWAGLLSLPDTDGHIPWAAWESGRARTSCAWALPCHWQVGTERIQLTDPDQLQLRPDHAAALHAALVDFMAPDGLQLEAQADGRWLLCGDWVQHLPCQSVERAVGRHLDTWIGPDRAPKNSPDAGAAHRRWLRLHQEVQMLLHTHPVNEEREAAGLPPVNALWLVGAGRLEALPAPVAGLGVLPGLRAPALAGDGPAWAQAWQALDAGPLRDLLGAQSQGEAVALTLCADHGWRTWGPNRVGFWARWSRSLRRPPAPLTDPLLEDL